MDRRIVNQLFAVPREVNHLTNVGCVVANAFEILGREEKRRGCVDPARIVAHAVQNVGDDQIVGFVDLPIRHPDLNGRLRIFADEGIQRRGQQGFDLPAHTLKFVGQVE